MRLRSRDAKKPAGNRSRCTERLEEHFSALMALPKSKRKWCHVRVSSPQSSWVVVFLWLGSRLAQAKASYSWGRSPGRNTYRGFFCICNTPPSHFLPQAKSLDCDRAPIRAQNWKRIFGFDSAP